jgi:hypothetical protein
VVLAVALTVLGSAGTALVAVRTGLGGGAEPLPSTPLAARARSGGPSGPASPPVGASLLSSPAPPGHGVPTLPPAQPSQPNVVHRTGRTMVCPEGIVPMVQIQGATFSPELKHGTTFGVGRYKVTVQGRVANETTAPIQLRSLQITIDGRPWHQTTAVQGVAAQDFAPISFEGFYDSTAPHRAVVDSRLQWQWQEPGLRSCGEEGLVEDD